MPPPMPRTSPGPQTLLLTTLALLIVAATLMLACNPAAQPIPDDGDVLTAAQPVAGGGEETPAEPEEPTATPVAEKPAVVDAPAQGLDAGKDTPTPEVAAIDATSTPGPIAATAKPTPQPATPTDTPTPEVLAKAAVPVAATPEKIAPQETENTESPEPTPTPTPRPTLCFQQGDGEICINEPAPVPTPKYPVLGDFSRYA